MKKISVVLVSFLLSPLLNAAIKTTAVEYKDGGATLLGYVVYDDAVKTKQPGVLVVHEWWGLNDYAKKRGEDIAKLGYVAFVVDVSDNSNIADFHRDWGKK
jgi:dienelactone hydrolase